jgi:hypothetical protein
VKSEGNAKAGAGLTYALAIFRAVVTSRRATSERGYDLLCAAEARGFAREQTMY